MAKWPLRPGDIERLEHEALRQSFLAAARRRGHNWLDDYVFPDWLMQKYVAEFGNPEGTGRVQSP